MKTTKQINNWIASTVKTELDQVPPDVMHSAKKLNRMDLITDHVSRKTGIQPHIITKIINTSNP